MEIITLDVNGNREQVLSTMSDYLTQKSFVKDTYKEALLKRERQYPTGLQFLNNTIIAIPHTDIEHVNKEAMIVAVPKNGIKFYQMDEPETELLVDMIFLLVIKDTAKYINILSKLTLNLQHEELQILIKNRKADEVVQYLSDTGIFS